ncbi:MAG: HigA family addiction module antidote protein [Candidatus Solibacter usitatus]|nr:HigA family addiction module antidote protein [Candidatus Solibacter usitatus]
MHPGYYLKEEMEARGWIQRDLAFILGVPEQAVNIILSGKRGISPDMARALGDAFDVPAEFFANLQKAYDLSRANQPNPGVAVRARMQGIYPIREMIKRSWIVDGDPTILNMQLERFFEADTLGGIPYLAHAAKKSSHEERGVPPTQLAWLFRVRQIAKSLSVPRYSEKSLRNAVLRLSAMLIEPEESRRVPQILMESGVRFIAVEGLAGARIDGVCFWLDDESPVIGMSMRYDRIDNFWFVLRHEVEHVLRKDGRSVEIIDDELEGDKASASSSLPEQERAANVAAADFCAPSAKVDSFIARKKPFFYEKDVLALARVLNRHPGLVVGQMQNRLHRYDYLKRYQVRIRNHVLPSAIVDGWGQTMPISI